MIALLAAAVAPAAAVDQPLIRYRQHAGQSVGPSRCRCGGSSARPGPCPPPCSSTKPRRIGRPENDCPIGPAVDPARLAMLDAKVAHCEARSAIRLNRRPRLPASVGELLSLRYSRFSLGWKSFAQDLFL